jgi:hypothetical protein
MTDKNKARVVTPEATLSFPALFSPKAFSEGDTPKYECELIFKDGTDLSAMKKAAEHVAREHWGADIPKSLRSPFRDGSTDREGKPEYEGATFMRAWSKSKPSVVMGPNHEPVLDESDVYSGCIVRVSVTAFAYDNKGNKGVSFYLNNVWKLRDGAPLASRVSAEDDFAGVAVDADAFGADDTPF